MRSSWEGENRSGLRRCLETHRHTAGLLSPAQLGNLVPSSSTFAERLCYPHLSKGVDTEITIAPFGQYARVAPNGEHQDRFNRPRGPCRFVPPSLALFLSLFSLPSALLTPPLEVEGWSHASYISKCPRIGVLTPCCPHFPHFSSHRNCGGSRWTPWRRKNRFSPGHSR